MRSLSLSTLAAAALLFFCGIAAAGKPTTLLGKWMVPYINEPRAAGDYPTLSKNLQLVADKRPPGDYPKWSAMAQAGADAAAKSNVKGVGKSCTDCHDAYREKFKKELATWPFP
jgi:hypothetical protein